MVAAVAAVAAVDTAPTVALGELEQLGSSVSSGL
jgi:hypothetical protein